jgi:hypothetical protein
MNTSFAYRFLFAQNNDGTGGEYQVCTTNTCETCGVNTPFNNAQCVANPPQYGALSVQFQCGPAQQEGGDGGTFRVRWYENADCPASALSDGDPTNHRTIVVGATDLCQRVPDSEFGYKVNCNAGNAAGQISFCTDTTCETCSVNRDFNNNQVCPQFKGFLYKHADNILLLLSSLSAITLVLFFSFFVFCYCDAVP